METQESQPTYAQLLDQIADEMTEENWCQRRFFSVNSAGGLCMCVHGRAQMKVNPEVQAVYKKYVANPNLAHYLTEVTRLLSSSDGLKSNVLFLSPAERRKVWDNRPLSVKNDHKGSADIHFLMRMVGLTVAYNDASTTTLEYVKRRVRAAALLARELGV